MFLTKRQKEIYDYLAGYITQNGYAPTFEEIGTYFQLSSLATIHKHLTNLEEKGLIRRRSNYSRAIEVLQHDRPGAVALPLLGSVAAGQPIEAIETDDTVVIPESFIGKGDTFALRVKGNSMIDDGIWDGDLIIVEERPAAENGQTVVAMIGGAATVKRFYREKNGKIRLQPANENMQPIVISAKEVSVRGVVVAVLRKY